MSLVFIVTFIITSVLSILFSATQGPPSLLDKARGVCHFFGSLHTTV